MKGEISSVGTFKKVFECNVALRAGKKVVKKINSNEAK